MLDLKSLLFPSFIYNRERVTKMKFNVIDQVANHQTTIFLGKKYFAMNKHIRLSFSVIIKCSRSLQMGLKNW